MRTEDSSSSQPSFNELANQLISQRQLAAARSVLEGAIREMPREWKPVRDDSDLHILVCSFWNTEELTAYVKAKQTGEYLIIWNAGSYSHAWHQLAVIAVEEGNLQSALSCIESGLALEPDHPDLWNEQGYILSRQGRYADSLPSYERAATVRDWATASQTARALRGKGSTLIDVKRLDEAEAALRQSLALDPESKIGASELEYAVQLQRIQELRAKLAESYDFPGLDFEPDEAIGRCVGGKAFRLRCGSTQVAVALIGTERVILVGDHAAEKLAGRIGVGFIHARELAERVVNGFFAGRGENPVGRE